MCNFSKFSNLGILFINIQSITNVIYASYVSI